MGKPAQKLTKAIRSYLATQGWLSWCNRSGCTKIGDRFIKFQEAGLPDVMAVKHGQLLCVEVKAGKDKLTELQAAWLVGAKRHGAVVVVANCVDDVVDYLASVEARA